jgi:mannose-6-phosphate isomerase
LFAEAVRRHDKASIRATLHRLDVAAGQVFVAHAGVPHYLGPGISFIEVQEPSDHIVIPETDGNDDTGATMGLGWDEALDMIDYRAQDLATTLARARQVDRVVREHHGSRETRLLNADVLEFFEATRLDVSGELPVEDGRFSIDIVTGGEGTVEGDFGAEPVRSGETLAFAASLGHRYLAGSAPLRVVRCMGPAIAGA